MRSTFLAAVLLAIAVINSPGPARAQESPELPSNAVTATEPQATPQFYKGKGPGRGNSYLERYEEDYSYLRDPGLSTDPFDPLKYIPFNPDGDVYLTLNGEVRFRYDNTDHKNFGIATAATPGKSPTFTTAIGISTNELYKQRYEIGGDLHLGPYVRFYGELYNGQQTGHDAGDPIPGNLRDDLAVVNGFGEIYDTTETTKTGFRAGRQEIFFGNNLQVRANVSTNLPSPVFDGFRVYSDWGFARIDGFAYNIVDFENGVLQDRDNAHTNLWGIYGSYDLPKFRLWGSDAKSSIDLFYFGWRSAAFANGKGSAIYNDAAFLTGGKIVAATGAGFITSQDHRDTFGLRYYGEIGN
ncbi:MAG TPA: hypothetical protein VN900_04045, partial [Stellaceae bacterium]|nr:hypothetical protein [Stellaceae bacterium]